MTLRRTLVILQLVVVTFGLAVFGVVSYEVYGDSQYQRAQESLRDAGPQLLAALCRVPDVDCDDNQVKGSPQGSEQPATSGPSGTDGKGSGPPESKLECGGVILGYGGLGFGVPQGSFVQLRSQRGQVIASLAASLTKAGCPAPELPAHLRTGPTTFVVDGKGGPFLASAARMTTGGGPPSEHGPPAGDVVVTAIGISAVTSSLRNLLVLELAVGGGLLVLLALVTLLLVRRSLAPLERMASTAGVIAGGDLAQRVPDGSPRSEVGQLGSALNRMLGSIEEAFAARDATEARLRQFLADASHELRTPLTSIRGYAELWRLSGGRAGEGGGDRIGPSGTGGGAGPAIDAGTAMARIEEHAERMGGMIEELLLLARLDQARPPQRELVDLAVLAAEACGDAVAIDPARRIRLDAPDPVVVTGDPAHLRRAVANLTVNAVRHTPPGSPIEVRAAVVDGMAELDVRDHGPGLQGEAVERAFDRFWQADASRHTGGSGLGLAIVAGVAAEHGGGVTATNAADGGAAFTLRLPLAAAGNA